VEIKPCPDRDEATAAAVVEIIRRHWPSGRPWPLLSSFSRRSLAVAKAAAPQLPRALLAWRQPPDWAAAATELDCVSVHCAHQHLTPAWAREIRDGGFELAVYTLDDAARARDLIGWGVQCIITDQPDVLLAAV
jgi:glycerophosphoryl diester phosphodiesterase